MAIGIGVVIALIGKVVISRIEPNRKAEKKEHFYTVEKVFGVLMVITACGMAFAHGSNDVANAIGPLAAVISVAQPESVGAKSACHCGCLFSVASVSSSASRRMVAT